MEKGSKRYRATPDIVKYFGTLVERWEKYAADCIYVKLKNMDFDGILIRAIPVGFDLITTDIKYLFACEVEVVPENEMNHKYRELYRKLKNLECEIIWKGKLLKKAVFHPIFDELRAYIPQIESSKTLIEILHANKDLMKLVNKVKPEELNVKLYSGIDITKSIQSINNFLKLQINFYYNPSKIAWIVKLTEGRYVISTNPYKLTTEICSLLNLIVKELKNIINFVV